MTTDYYNSSIYKKTPGNIEEKRLHGYIQRTGQRDNVTEKEQPKVLKTDVEETTYLGNIHVRK